MSLIFRTIRSLGTHLAGAFAPVAGLILISNSVAAYAQSAPSAYTSGTRYDNLGRVTGTIAPDPDGAGALTLLATRTTYDVRGNVTKVETGALASWQSEAVAPANWSGFAIHTTAHSAYDAMNRKTRDWVVGSDNITVSMTQYSYDNVGRLQCTAQRMNPATYGALPASACTLATAGPDGPDRISKTIYDKAGQVLQVRRAVGTALEQAEVTYSYTQNGKQQFVIDANGNKAQMVYDGHDRQNRWSFPSKTAPTTYNDVTHALALSSAGSASTTDYEQYSYDANGNRTQLRKRDAQLINYAYDALNRNTVKNLPGTAADVYYGYDNRGLQTYARFVNASGVGITTTYDNAGRVLSSTNNMAGGSRTLTYQYDKNNNRTRITHPDGQYFAYSYDGLNRSNDVHENGSTRTTANRYNDKGQFHYNLRQTGLQNTHAYDLVGRTSSILIDIAGTAQDNTFGFAYTPGSQIKSRTTSNDLYANTAHYDVTRDYQVNGLNQYTGAGPSAFTYDANGNLNSDGAVNFTYDVENRLVATTGAKTANLIYDPLGRLYETNQGGAAKTRFLYDGDALVLEYDQLGTIKHRYVHGSGVDDPLVWYDGGTVNTTNRRHLFANWQGSITAITDATGNIVQVNAYDAYGIPNATNLGRFQYTGQILIPEIGIYHYKARAYSPYLGRFLQTDPIGYEDQYNLYAYVGNDPVNNSDPTGLACTSTESSGFCTNSRRYAIFARSNSATTTFFRGASIVSAALNSVTSRGGKAFTSRSTRIFLQGVNNNLVNANVKFAASLLGNGKSVAENDRAFVRFEQGRVQAALDKLKNLNSDAYDRVIAESNAGLNGSLAGLSASIFDPIYASAVESAKGNLGVDNLDFANKDHRIAIGDALLGSLRSKSATSCTHTRIKSSC